jgi:hypothetical protein
MALCAARTLAVACAEADSIFCLCGALRKRGAFIVAGFFLACSERIACWPIGASAAQYLADGVVVGRIIRVAAAQE